MTELRKFFTSHVPLFQHVVWWWYEAEHYTTFDTSVCVVEGGDRGALRWGVIETFGPVFWSEVPVKVFLADNWARWEAEKPAFFIAEQIAQIPDLFLPPLALEARCAGRTPGASFLSSSSSRSSRMTAAAAEPLDEIV